LPVHKKRIFSFSPLGINPPTENLKFNAFYTAKADYTEKGPEGKNKDKKGVSGFIVDCGFFGPGYPQLIYTFYPNCS
jgi:hypothetical protein